MDYVLKRWPAFTRFLDDGGGLPQQQRGGTSPAWHCSEQKIMAVCRFRPRRAASRRSVQPDRHRQDERHRSAGLAGRCPGPHRRTPCPRYRCFAAMELAASRGITQPGGLTSQPQTSNYPAVFTACFPRLRPEISNGWWSTQRCSQKAVAHPTDARLCHRALEKLVDLAQRYEVPLT